MIYAIGDVHGCLDELVALEDAILKDGARRRAQKLIIMLGDYVDRGPHSAQVIDHLLSPLPEGFERLCLCGNHEAMMLDFLKDPLANLGWLDVGGDETMASYGVDAVALIESGRSGKAVAQAIARAVPARHLTFLRTLPVLAVRGRLAFVHAGIRPGIPLKRQKDRDMLWIREPFNSAGPDLPITVIHGHTPGSVPVRGKGRICIDTGACYTGRLTALRIAGTRGAFLYTRAHPEAAARTTPPRNR